MNCASHCRLALLAALALAAAACPQRIPPEYSTPPEIPPNVLGPDDVVEIRVHRQENLTGAYTLGADGGIDFPLLGRVVLGARTEEQAAAFLMDQLEPDYLKKPQISVLVREYNSRKVSVIGQVKKPGRITYRAGMTLVEAIAEAGGTTDRAALQMVQVTRSQGEGERFEVPFRKITTGKWPDFFLIPGDIVFVNESAVR